MIRKVFSLSLLLPFVFTAGFIYAGGAYETSSGNILHNVENGIITSADMIEIDDIIASVDYEYPEPENELGISIYSGNRQIAANSGDQVFVIGIQGAEIDLSELPPVNICFVIDHSGSMGGGDKMSWVHESFEIFLETVRGSDYISVVQFDDTAEVMFSPVKMGTGNSREKLLNIVKSIVPRGGTDLAKGFELGYQQVLSSFNKNYINRVIFMTDGMGNSEGMHDMVKTFKDMGIYLTTIGLGTGYNGELLSELARLGGGTSRFISNKEKMDEMFGSGFARMTVPVANRLEIKAEFPKGFEITGTWAPEYKVKGRKAEYYYPAVHVGDYETVVIKTSCKGNKPKADIELIKLSASYNDSSGKRKQINPVILKGEIVEEGKETDGFSDAYAMKAGTMLKYARSLVSIGKLYYEKYDYQNNKPADAGILKPALDTANRIKKELIYVSERFNYEGFKDEITVMKSYIKILSSSSGMKEKEVSEIIEDREPPEKIHEYSFPEKISGLFNEMILSFKDAEPGPVAVTGFSFKDNRDVPFLDLVSGYAETGFVSKLDFPVIEQKKLDNVLAQQKMTLSGLYDTAEAVEVGRLLSSRYIVTGNIIEMKKSLIIFSRIIDIETAEIVTAAQIIIKKDSDISDLIAVSGS